MIGVEFCEACEQPATFRLVGSRCNPFEATRAFGRPVEECQQTVQVGWHCQVCGTLGRDSMGRLLIHLAALGCVVADDERAAA